MTKTGKLTKIRRNVIAENTEANEKTEVKRNLKSRKFRRKN